VLPLGTGSACDGEYPRNSPFSAQLGFEPRFAGKKAEMNKESR
jgi:hypothetical protein